VHRATGNDKLTSTVSFINLELEFENQAPQVYSLLVKVSTEDPIYRDYVDAEVLFHNEIHMYTEVIPFLEEILKKQETDLLGEIFPKWYYVESGADCVGGKDIVVLDNMVLYLEYLQRLLNG
jgi:hypothetical protein